MFYDALRKALKKRKTTIEKSALYPICRSPDLEEYGAIFLAVKKVLPPQPACSLPRSGDGIQQAAGFVAETIADAEIELQAKAMESLLKAREEAAKEDWILRHGAGEAARRNYDDACDCGTRDFFPLWTTGWHRGG